MSDTVPIVLGPQGYQPQQPSALLAQLLAIAAATDPGYTALPASLIEDISSTDVAAVSLCDSAYGETVNSVTPYGANAFILNQLGQIYGVQPNQSTNTSVYVVFTGSPGFVIAQGFTVSDGTNQYIVQNGGVIASNGSSAQLYCVALLPGTFAVPANTVNQLITSLPQGVSLSVNNPSLGTPAIGTETEGSYRSRVLQAGLASAQGMPRFMKTLLAEVDGVQSRLISVRQPGTNQWEIIVGGGDPYEVAYAIFTGLFDISTLVGSVLGVASITQANPGVATTDLNHGFATGQIIQINGATGMTAINGTDLTITVITETTFSVGVDTSGYGAYTGNGVVTPNFRNTSVNLFDSPNSYSIPIVLPPQQSVAITLTWNTSSPNYVSDTAFAQLAAPALVAYVNSISVGQPINLFELQNSVQVATASIVPTALLTRMVFSVEINGVGVSPESGTGIIAGDPESYFLTDVTQISISQG